MALSGDILSASCGSTSASYHQTIQLPNSCIQRCNQKGRMPGHSYRSTIASCQKTTQPPNWIVQRYNRMVRKGLLLWVPSSLGTPHSCSDSTSPFYQQTNRLPNFYTQRYNRMARM
jgi:hypothetical protein